MPALAGRLPEVPACHHSSSPHSGATRQTSRAQPLTRATGRRILLIASGGAADLRRVDPALLHPADRLVLHDVDPDALQYALTHLPPATRAQAVAAPGNVLRTAAHLAADHGPFDLVLAGGLFDYLEERFARALIRTTLSRLCRPGDTFYFSNIATPNPYAA
ncbi:class I SAM-dependent methyltransferase [Streptomyces sp. NPDC005479]|uniref:class I SAM-dependent methyltransferase n=1 Tax=unclassified Streptomyces TaxID=2593676 RepID=UPI00339EED9A